MKTLPPLIVVADRGHFIAYQPLSNGALKEIHSMDIAEGLQKLSDQVTDQAGRFPNTGNFGNGNSSAERMPLEAELEMRSFRKIAQAIKDICDAQQPSSWAFAAPSEINSAILDGLPAPWRDRLEVNLRLDLTGVPSAEVAKRVMEHVQRPLPVS